MEALKNVNRAILNTLMQIEESFPELSKYLGEMPVRLSENPAADTGLKNLQDYADSLNVFLKKYAKTHIAETNSAPAFSYGKLPGSRRTLNTQTSGL